MERWGFKLTLLLLITFISGCASIPPEAPTLSAELGNRIESLEKANTRLLKTFFAHKRNQVDAFIEDEWLPIFANKFFQKPKMARAWNSVVSENDKPQRTKFIIKVGTKLQKAINKKHRELIKPLKELEARLISALEAEYAQAKAVNNSITSLLLSASKVTQNRDRLLAKAGLSQERITKAIDKTEDIVSKLLDGAKTVDEKATIAEEYITKLQELKNSF